MLSLTTLTAVMLGTANAATVTVTNIDDGVSNVGAPGTLYWAITNCNAGDTIAFNIDTGVHGPGPYYFKGPPPFQPPYGGGLPLVYKKHNLLIDGYTQPGASPNNNAITQANNAVIKIVIDARSGGSRGMDYGTFDGTIITSDPPIDNTSMAGERTGYGNDERALLGIYRSTNVWVRGLAFLSSWSDPYGNQKGICLAHDYGLDTTVTNREAYTEGSDAGFHVSGCWFGVDPTNQTVTGVDTNSGTYAIAHYRHRDVSGGPRPELPNFGLIVGVAPGSANPRAEFNVFCGYAYVTDGENLRTRLSGNFVNVLPNGITPYNVPERNYTLWADNSAGMIEWGRYDDTVPMIIGTDGDGVNDADEGNLFGPQAWDAINNLGAQPYVFDFYGTSRKSYVIAGNRFGIAVDGTVWTNNSYTIGGFSFGGGTQIRFGSDYNGVSDELEANIVYNNNVFGTLFSIPSAVTPISLFGGTRDGVTTQKDSWWSIRGNVMVDNFAPFIPDFYEALNYYPWWTNAYVAADDTNVVPILSGSSTISTLIGTFKAPNTSSWYTNAVVVDVYEPDPLGEANGALFGLPVFGGPGNGSPGGYGFVQSKKHLGSYLLSNPSSGSFSLDISGLGLAHGTKVTVALTYSSFAQPKLTSISRSGGNTTLAWTGDNGGPYPVAGAGAPSSGFGVARATSLNGPWTTTYAAGNSITVADATGTTFYRIVAPISGPTTLFAPPVTLP